MNRVVVLGIAFCAVVVGQAAGAQERSGANPPARPMMPRQEQKTPDALTFDVPGAQMPGADPFQLLENSQEVQTDLGLTPDQLSRLNRASRNFRTQLQELSSPRAGLPPNEARAKIEQHIDDTRGMIARELTPTQLARLQQIMLQLEGPCLAMADQPVADQLRLTEDQHQAIAKACDGRTKQMREAFKPPGANASFCDSMIENRNRVEQVRSRADQRILALLDASQKERLQRLSGRKLKLTPPMPPECN